MTYLAFVLLVLILIVPSVAALWLASQFFRGAK